MGQLNPWSWSFRPNLGTKRKFFGRVAESSFQTPLLNLIVSQHVVNGVFKGSVTKYSFNQIVADARQQHCIWFVFFL